MAIPCVIGYSQQLQTIINSPLLLSKDGLRFTTGTTYPLQLPFSLPQSSSVQPLLAMNMSQPSFFPALFLTFLIFFFYTVSKQLHIFFNFIVTSLQGV
jgi:hypothetical protein